MAPGLIHSKKAAFIIFWSFVLHLFYVLPFVRTDTLPYSNTFREIAYGVILMLYPLSGWLTDTYSTRYKSMLIGLVLAMIGTAASVVLGLIYSKALLGSFIIVRIGHWFFEVNAIMYGFQQLEAYSIEDHRVFVYWFYWALEIGHFLYGLFLCSLTPIHGTDLASKITSAVLGSVQVIIMLVVLIVMLVKRHKFGDKHIGYHPLSKIIQVVFQSLRKPFGMEKLKIEKGGLHSSDFIREIRTFLFIVIVICPLSIVYYTEEIYTVAKEFRQESRNTSEDFQKCLLVEVPTWIRSAMAAFFIPIYITILTPLVARITHYKWLLLRMGVGLTIAILGIVSLFGIQLNLFFAATSSTNITISERLTSYTQTNACSYIDDTQYYWLVIPEALNGFSVVVVFSTALEFICAQSSSAIRGLLIAIWFALDGLLKCIVTIQEVWHLDCNIYYYLGKLALVTMFLVMFFMALRAYTKQNRRQEEEFEYTISINNSSKLNNSNYNYSSLDCSNEKDADSYYKVTDSALGFMQ